MRHKIISFREVPRFLKDQSIFVHYPEDLNVHRPYHFYRGRIKVHEGGNTISQYRSPHFMDLEPDAFLSNSRYINQEQLFKYENGELSPYSISSLKSDAKTQELELSEINPIYYNILRDLDSPVSHVFISDLHGAANKLFQSITLFPGAKLVSTGDIFDRADDQLATNQIFSMFHYEDKANPDVKETMGNHDAMVFGAVTGELTSIAHYLRFALRYNEVDYLSKMGLDLSKLSDLAMQRNYKGNYKAKGEVNYKLEALCTDIQLKLTYGDPAVTLNDDEQALLHNLKFSGDELEIKDYSLNKLYRKIQSKMDLNPFEAKLVERIKKGNNQLSAEELQVLKDMQIQIIKNENFRDLMNTVLKRFKMYETVSEGDKNFLFFHSNIPTDENGGMRAVDIDGVKYKGIDLLDAIQKKVDSVIAKYEDLDVEDPNEVDDFLSWIKMQRGFFDWLAWSYDSPVYGRVMKTFERAYLPKESGLYDEPKDQWYKQVQTKEANTYMAQSMMRDLATQLNIPAESLHIVNGHTPNKSGMVETFLDGKMIRIDAGFSSAYGNLGAVILLTEKGTVYSLSLSETDNVINKYTLHKIDEKGNVVKVNNGLDDLIEN